MDTDVKKIIEERIKKLPTHVVSVIKNVPWLEKMKEIARNNSLSLEKESLFIIETTLLVLGIETPKKYPVNLSEKVRLDDEAVVKIAKEVDEKILKPIEKMIESSLIQKQDSKSPVIIGDWQDKVKEISKKYNLKENQENSLINLVRYRLNNTTQPSNFVQKIIAEIVVSPLLAEQIMEDLENRVFKYPIKSPAPTQEKINNVTNPAQKIPEVRPEILPIAEKNEGVKISVPNYIPQNIEKKPEQKIEQAPPQKAPQPTPEPVQKPFSVPRFTGTPQISERPVYHPDHNKRAPSSIVDNKLNNVTKGITETPLAAEPIKKYESDPYREPTN